MRALVVIVILLLPMLSHGATYYISPSGSNANDGLSTGAPFLTFAYAVDAARAWCGDTLVPLDGTYGHGTSTGKLNINGIVCAQGTALTIRANNQRKAKIFDNGTGYAIRIQNSAYIILDGLYSR